MNTLNSTIIECPECRTRYELPLVIPESGRKVRCSKCAFVWIAKPPAEEPAAAQEALDDIVVRPTAEADEPPRTDIEVAPQAQPPAPEPLPAPPPDAIAPPAPEPVAPEPVAPEPVAAKPSAEAPQQEPRVNEIYEKEAEADVLSDADLDIEFAASEFDAVTGSEASDTESDTASDPAALEAALLARQSGPRSGAAVALSWMLLLAVIGATGYGAIAGREQVVAMLPGTAGVYEKLGMPVNVRGLEFRKIGYGWTAVAGRQMLEVTGEVVNVSDRARPVPMLEFALRNAENAEIYQWTEEPAAPSLKAGEVTAFKASLDSPPQGVAKLQVRFARKN